MRRGPTAAVPNAKRTCIFECIENIEKENSKTMTKAGIALGVLATTLAGRAALAQTQDSTTNGITIGGHIGFVLPLVTHVGGKTINDTADQFWAGARLAFDVNSSDWGFTPLVNHSWPIKGSEHSFFKTYFIEGDLPVRFNRPVNGPKTNAVTFAMHFGLGF
jgi:hypothetical protein